MPPGFFKDWSCLFFGWHSAAVLNAEEEAVPPSLVHSAGADHHGHLDMGPAHFVPAQGAVVEALGDPHAVDGFEIAGNAAGFELFRFGDAMVVHEQCPGRLLF